MTQEQGDKDAINPKQRKFCNDYMLHLNGTKAYLHAYPDTTEEAATSSASRMLTDANVKAYIKYMQANLEEAAGITKLKVIQEWQKMAFSSMGDYHNTWISKKEFDSLTNQQKACIESIETSEVTIEGMTTTTFKLKLHSKKAALENLAKILGYNDPTTGLEDMVIKINIINPNE